MESRIIQALQWITEILQQQSIPFQITGGLAVKIYGGKRLVRDIDIEIPDSCFDKLTPLVQDYIIYGPERYQDAYFDLLLMKLNYKGQEIDISGADSPKLFNKTTKQWKDCRVDLSRARKKMVNGLSLHVAPAQDIVDYKKKKESRPEDIEDIKFLESCQNKKLI